MNIFTFNYKMEVVNVSLILKICGHIRTLKTITCLRYEMLRGVVREGT